MEIKQRKSVIDRLDKYHYGCDKEDFIEITEWTNGDGIDVNITYEKSERNFSLSYEELNAIQYLAAAIQFEKNEEK